MKKRSSTAKSLQPKPSVPASMNASITNDDRKTAVEHATMNKLPNGHVTKERLAIWLEQVRKGRLDPNYGISDEELAKTSRDTTAEELGRSYTLPMSAGRSALPAKSKKVR